LSSSPLSGSMEDGDDVAETASRGGRRSRRLGAVAAMTATVDGEKEKEKDETGARGIDIISNATADKPAAGRI
jgi:hypothetical protein